ncbi:MAG TPA: CAP domain-containing protein [Gemmatimonadaceae bacterium]|nr:CAP domain-containing protein [Gemmatimonadaceae bacterium]
MRGDRFVQRSGRARFEAFALIAAAAATSCTLAVPQPADSTRALTPAAAADSLSSAVDYRRIEREVAVELNAARRDPGSYSMYLAELIPMFDGDVMRRPNHPVGVRTTEGAAAVREAVGALRAQAAEPPLAFAQGLAAAARELAVDEGRTGAVGHTGADGSTPATRIARHGAWSVSYAENIDYGTFTSGRDVVLGLLIDDGVPERGHRRNIFDPTARVVGVACAKHPKFGSVCVIDQAGAFTAR